MKLKLALSLLIVASLAYSTNVFACEEDDKVAKAKKQTVQLAAVDTQEKSKQASKTAAPQEKDIADIVDTAVQAGTFTSLATAISVAGLQEALKGEGPFTIFAPNDAAFDQVPLATRDAVLGNTETLKKVLSYHAVSGKMTAQDLMAKESLDTLEGQSLSLAKDDDGNVTVDGARIITVDIMASNGVIHVINQVLVPSDVEIQTPAAEASESTESTKTEKQIQDNKQSKE